MTFAKNAHLYEIDFQGAEALFAKCRNSLKAMARPAGLEPATPGLEGRCSIQLSYGRLTKDLNEES